MDEKRKKAILAAVGRWTWGSLVVLIAGSALVVAYVLLDWADYAAMCLLGILAGLSASYALVGRDNHRTSSYYVALAFGLVLLPAIAIYLGWVAAYDEVAFTSWNGALTPFAAFALVTLSTRAILSGIWRPREIEEEVAEEVEEESAWLVPKPVSVASLTGGETEETEVAEGA
ncbi:MAG: hypothetical protein OEV43_00025 [Coriobacteriia bacterium]|nr:hypothetical protein [Coriobacteriia bacterium]